MELMVHRAEGHGCLQGGGGGGEGVCRGGRGGALLLQNSKQALMQMRQTRYKTMAHIKDQAQRYLDSANQQ